MTLLDKVRARRVRQRTVAAAVECVRFDVQEWLCVLRRLLHKDVYEMIQLENIGYEQGTR